MDTLHNINPPSRRISLPDEALRKHGIRSIPQSLGAATFHTSSDSVITGHAGFQFSCRISLSVIHSIRFRTKRDDK